MLLGRTVFGLARTLFDLQTFIANLFLMQGVNEVFQQTQAVRDTFTPTQILRSIVQAGLYDPAFIDPAELPRQQLLEAFEQHNFPITIAYEPLTASPNQLSPLRLLPSGVVPVGERVFQRALSKTG